ncbi:MAG: lipoate--protein ligase [Isosphaeraceae bacterium]
MPTLSLGYFQSIIDARREPRWAASSIVRRLTGGGAIWHDRELTYAVTLPGDHPAARPNTGLYREIHAAILEVLRRRGLDAHRRGPSEPPLGAPESSGKSPFLCFTDRDPEDIVFAASKIVGSAQRRRRGAILQHGSILLGRSSATPELPGVAEFLATGPEPGDWAESVMGAIVARLGMDACRIDPPAGLMARAGELERSVYRDPGWTERR